MLQQIFQLGQSTDLTDFLNRIDSAKTPSMIQREIFEHIYSILSKKEKGLRESIEV
jgi:hypothetical protein